VIGTGSGQLSALLVVPRRAPTGLPVQLLLDRQIPDKPGVATMLRQHRLLVSGRKQPVSRHTGNVTATTDKSPKGEAALRPPAKASEFHAATTP
jgi:hypothetical protein